MGSRTFTNYIGTEEPEFNLETQVLLENGKREGRVEHFRCLPEAPAGAIADYMHSADMTGVLTVPAMFDFLSKTMWPDEWKRLKAMADAPEFQIRVPVLGEIVQWLVEEYAGHPFVAPSASSNGSTPTPAIAGGDSLATGSISTP